MLTIKRMREILSEKDPYKRNKLIEALPDEDKKSLLKEAEKLHREAEALRSDG